MAIHYIEIPQPPDPNFQIGVVLLGVPYLFDFRWNVRAAAWFLDVNDVQEKPIWNGIRIVIGMYLGRACNAQPFTNGVLQALDLSGAGADPGLDDFGTRVRLTYMPAVDLLALMTKAGTK